jgi:malonyl-CoA O-methyltransferase
LDRRLLLDAFERAAAGYEQAAFLSEEIGRRLLESLAGVRMTPRSVLDVGAGSGVFTRALRRQYPKARLIALDLSHAMLCEARARTKRFFSNQRFVRGDMAALPLAADSVDLSVSNIALPWCSDLTAVFAELRRVTRPGGLVLFSTLGRETLVELRDAWKTVDDYEHVHAFIDMHDIGDALLATGFADVVVHAERLTIEYQDVERLMRDLKTAGAHNVGPGRRRGLTGAGSLQAMVRAYEQYRTDGNLPATFEVVYAHGLVPERRPGTAEVPVSALDPAAPRRDHRD